jgi:hypothetical protein
MYSPPVAVLLGREHLYSDLLIRYLGQVAPELTLVEAQFVQVKRALVALNGCLVQPSSRTAGRLSEGRGARSPTENHPRAGVRVG